MTNKEWLEQAKEAIADLPPRANKQKIERIMNLWNERVPEFFSRKEDLNTAESAAGCGRCIGRFKDVFSMRIELLEKEFAIEKEVVVETNPPVAKPAAKPKPKKK